MRAGDIMRSILRAIILLTSSLMIPVPGSAQGVVYLASSPPAQGIPRATPAGCTIVTAQHAILGHGGKIPVVQSDGRRAEAEVSELYDHQDVAVLRVVNDGNVPVCSRSVWPQSSLPGDAPPGGPLELRTVQPNGVLSITNVTVEAYDRGQRMHVRPLRSGDKLVRGMSGGALVVRDRVIGMLIRVDGNGVGEAYGLGYLAGLLGPDPLPRGNLSGLWEMTKIVGPSNVRPAGTVVRVEHLGERMKITLEKGGGDLEGQESWKEGVVIWSGEVPDVAAPSMTAYGRPVVSSQYRPLFPRHQAHQVHTREVPFVIKAPSTIETTLIVGETAWNEQTHQLEMRPRALDVTLSRIGDANRKPPKAEDPPPPPQASATDALQTLSGIFRSAGRYRVTEVPRMGTIEMTTSVKSLSACRLVIEEQGRWGAGDIRKLPPNYYHSWIETTTMDLRKIAVDDIRSAEGALAIFPDAWAISVVASGNGIMVHRIDYHYGQPREPQEQPMEQVHFLTVHKAGADQAARAMEVLASSCGAR
jgi:hypothetical protein